MLSQILALAGFFILAIVIMGLALTFSKYKKDENHSCCGGGHCSVGEGGKKEHIHTCKIKVDEN